MHLAPWKENKPGTVQVGAIFKAEQIGTSNFENVTSELWKRYIRTPKTLYQNFENVISEFLKTLYPNFENVTSELQHLKRYIRTLKRYIRTETRVDLSAKNLNE